MGDSGIGAFFVYCNGVIYNETKLQAFIIENAYNFNSFKCFKKATFIFELLYIKFVIRLWLGGKGTGRKIVL